MGVLISVFSSSVAYGAAENSAADGEKTAVCINEVQVSNLDMFIDPTFNFGSWVEIFNGTDQPYSLKGCYLSDDPDLPKKWTISWGKTIPAGGFFVVCFGHYSLSNYRQVDDNLDADGGVLYLSDAEGYLLDEMAFPPAISRMVWARTTDGGDAWSWTDRPTYGASNAAAIYADEQLDEPVVSAESCIFADPFTFKVTIPPGTTLRYTTDGSIPTLEHGSTSADGSFSVRNTASYRFRLYCDDYLPSPVVTRSFINSKTKITLPVVSVIADKRMLYDDSIGIMVGGVNGVVGLGQSVPCNWNCDWDRVAHFTYILPDGSVPIDQETEMAIRGGWSRATSPHSFQLKADKQFDQKNTLDCPFFPTTPHLQHRAVRLRAGGQDNACRLKDPALHTIIQTSGLDLDVLGYQPVLHYINGTYKGFINLREPNNKHYIRTHFGYDDDEIDMFQLGNGSGDDVASYGYTQKEGTKESLDSLGRLARNCADDAVYDAVCRLLDIDEYINYMATEIYLGNTDWVNVNLPNNVKGWRPREEGGRFRFTLFDLDHTFETTSTFDRFNTRQTIPNLTTGQREDYVFLNMFKDLCASPRFRKQFIDAFSLVTGSVFDYDRVAAIVDSLATNVAGIMKSKDGLDPWPMAETIKRSVKGRGDVMQAEMRAWAPLKASSLSRMAVTFSSNIVAARLFLNDLPVPTNRFSGTVYAPAVLRAEAPKGYCFKGWYSLTASGRLGKCNTTEPTFTIPAGKQMKLRAIFERMDDGAPRVCINEVSASEDVAVNEYFKHADWVELYNSSSEPIDVAGMFLSDDLYEVEKWRISRPSTATADATVIQPGGHRIIWCDKKGGISQLHAPFKLDADSGVVVLTAADHTWADTLAYVRHTGHESVGRFPDGGDKCYVFAYPTIEKTNRMNSYVCLYDEQALLESWLPTSVDRMTVEDESARDPIVYDLLGRRVGTDMRSLRPGIYIINGRKVRVN